MKPACYAVLHFSASLEGAVERQLVFTAAQLADGLSLEFMGDGSAEVLNVSAWRGFLLTVR